ncbi:MAG: hypothetical protein LBE82_11040 [Chitinophagaceae bacterium]|jgi:hypothetical protein|nr:hypothetical protein [Chitinophagaceae bacterium]
MQCGKAFAEEASPLSFGERLENSISKCDAIGFIDTLHNSEKIADLF